MNHLGIDVLTEHVPTLIRRLKSLATTVDASDGGVYREDPNLSQVHVQTHMSEKQLDAWLYMCRGIDYIGTFKRNES